LTVLWAILSCPAISALSHPSNKRLTICCSRRVSRKVLLAVLPLLPSDCEDPLSKRQATGRVLVFGLRTSGAIREVEIIKGFLLPPSESG